mmetsp:Transcript_77849/g.170537  ORF Transcript_77849/g.170537 Transcript_77849/m.170537 type:complete len:319 (+) Transcript_77849:1057-2013(+)
MDLVLHKLRLDRLQLRLISIEVLFITIHDTTRKQQFADVGMDWEVQRDLVPQRQAQKSTQELKIALPSRVQKGRGRIRQEGDASVKALQETVGRCQEGTACEQVHPFAHHRAPDGRFLAEPHLEVPSDVGGSDAGFIQELPSKLLQLVPVAIALHEGQVGLSVSFTFGVTSVMPLKSSGQPYAFLWKAHSLRERIQGFLQRSARGRSIDSLDERPRLCNILRDPQHQGPRWGLHDRHLLFGVFLLLLLILVLRLLHFHLALRFLHLILGGTACGARWLLADVLLFLSMFLVFFAFLILFLLSNVVFFFFFFEGGVGNF